MTAARGERQGELFPPLVLIGPMAAGKTKTAKRVAKLLSLPVHDTDEQLVRQFGAISQQFADVGEVAFRERERHAVAEALSRGGVISLGGGAITHPQTQLALHAAWVVYLHVDLATVANRISRDNSRPLLAGDPLGAWQRLFDERRASYEALADLTLDTSHRLFDAVAQDIAHWYRTEGGKRE